MNVQRRGNKLGFWFFRTALRCTGLYGAYGLLYFVCLYYLLFDRGAVSASMAYVRRRFRASSTLRKYCAVYMLFISQGKTLIDRYYVVSGLGRFDIELQGYDRIKSLLKDSGKGMILLTAHVGNWQVTMTALEKLGRTVYLLMSPEENAAVKQSLNIDRDDEKVRVISPDGHLGGVIEIMKAIEEGGIVSIMGDRSYGHSTAEVELMGDRAFLPYSAFSIAAAAQCPVVVMLSARLATGKYFVDMSHVMEPRPVPRSRKKDAIEGLVQEYARVLEQYSGAYPYQWFMFHDLWEKENTSAAN